MPKDPMMGHCSIRIPQQFAIGIQRLAAWSVVHTSNGELLLTGIAFFLKGGRCSAHMFPKRSAEVTMAAKT